MKKILAYLTCNFSLWILKLFKRGGSLPGELALKIDNNILQKVKFPKDVILVTATNGKTTTTNLIAQTLMHTGKKVIYNHKGDNLIYGITTLILSNCDLRLNVKADIVVIEIDELSLARHLHQIPANFVIVNNFFRDQLDRSGEMETVVSRIENALKNYTGALILNQDDPNVLRLKNQSEHANVFTYHLTCNSLSSEVSHEASEGKFCPICHARIQYDFYQYSHLGQYNCPQCGFGKNIPSVIGENIDVENGIFEVNGIKYQSSNANLYHLYNCLAVITLSQQLGIDSSIVVKSIRDFKLALGRNEVIALAGKPCTLNLVKNPTGCNEILKAIKKDTNSKSILFALNDNPQDSCDVSWIWDVDFEMLDNVSQVICCGQRAYEIALRIKYGGLKCRIVVKDSFSEAVDYLKDQEDALYALATYTSLPKVRKEMYTWN